MPDLFKRDELIIYEFTAKTWKYQGHGAWHFVSLPAELTTEIREIRKWQEEGWGRLKILAKTGGSEWETAIWFDTKHETYLLPIKAEIRKNEKIEIGENVKIIIWI